jgi:hypothetical protein
MTILILTFLLLQTSGQALSPCEEARLGKAEEAGGAFSLKEICRIERKMPLIKDGMSWEEVLKKLGVWKKKRFAGSVIAHGGMVYHGLGNGYVLATPFRAEGQLKRVLLQDKMGRIVKSVEWR